MRRYQKILFLIAFSMVGFMGCEDQEKSNVITEYEGPILELTNVESLYSDSSVVRLKLIAPRQLEYENNDHEFPDGI